jgi:hypothetical protein
MAFMWIVGVGYRWVVVDTSLAPAHPIELPTPTPHA